MTKYFKTEQEAQNYLLDKTKDLYQIQTEILTTFSDDIFFQEHYSFFDFTKDTKHRFSIYQKNTGFEVEIQTIKYSKLVLAAEIGDLKLFEENLNEVQTIKAKSLAFVKAIENESIDILEYYIDNKELIDSLSLFKKPLLHCTYGDRLNSFLFLLNKGHTLPKEILSYIFLNNAIKILGYILKDKSLSVEILKEDFISNWTLIYLNDIRKQCEATIMFKDWKNSC